jgi:Zn-dependent peptidase ImmA (M78 family)
MFGGVLMLVRHDFARIKARMLLKGFKPPLDLEKIADRLGIKYHYHCLAGVNCSFSIKHGNRYIIGISISGNQEEDRRAFARQLGHIVLGHFELYDMDLLDEERLNDHEREILIQEADIFAEELLMPTQRMLELTRKSTGKDS